MADTTEIEQEMPFQENFIVDEATDEILRVKLSRFEGPLEVLLYLIKSQEIDIFDIPIAKITEQYLAFLEMMEEENLDIAGEYLVMAATLIQIKSKMILPVDMDDEDDIDEEDPRLELVEKLIAYRKYRDITSTLQEMEERRDDWFTRNAKPVMEVDENDEDGEFIEVSLFDLTKAFKGVLRFLAEDVPHTVEMEGASVDEKIDYIRDLLDEQESVAWMELFEESRSRVELVCSFLAILELCRMGAISAHQHKSYGDIRLFKKTPQIITT